MSSTLDVIRRTPTLIKKLAVDHAALHHKGTPAPQPQALQHATIQRAITNPATLTPADVPQLQRLMGNGAVSSLLGRARAGQERTGGLRVGASNDAHEREARQVANQVSGNQSVQRSRQSVSEITQEATIGAEGGVVNRKVEDTIQAARSGGRPVPDEVRLKMEQQTGNSYQDVQVHANEQSHEANASIGARAFTQGKHIYLGRNQSPYNVQLMAHELTHTDQQSAGRNVKNGVADIQRDDDKDIKKLNKKIRKEKLKKGIAKVGGGITKVLDWLITAPVRLIDQVSVLDLHFKDFGNFVDTGKTRGQRNKEKDTGYKYNTGNLKRAAGRTGLRPLMGGINIHGSYPKVPVLSNPLINPIALLGQMGGTLNSYGEKSDKNLRNLREEKNLIRNGGLQDDNENIDQGQVNKVIDFVANKDDNE